MGMPNLRLVVAPHPIGGINPEEVEEKADKIFGSVISQIMS
jgi:hypothetical protein